MPQGWDCEDAEIAVPLQRDLKVKRKKVKK
jgi:hypothetical protein